MIARIPTTREFSPNRRRGRIMFGWLLQVASRVDADAHYQPAGKIRDDDLVARDFDSQELC